LAPPGRHPEIGFHSLGRSQARAIIDRVTIRDRCDRTDAGHGHEALHGLVILGEVSNFLVELRLLGEHMLVNLQEMVDDHAQPGPVCDQVANRVVNTRPMARGKRTPTSASMERI